MSLSSLKSLFKKAEIFSEEKFYTFVEKYKVIVFVPAGHIEKLHSAMSKAGAGIIGNYEMCSFRTEGTGTFKPVKKAEPFLGMKNRLSYEKEIKLEAECGKEVLNKVIEALLKHHPYEEVAYEVYQFFRRSRKESGVVLELKKEMTVNQLINRINRKLETDIYSQDERFRKIIILDSNQMNDINVSAKLADSRFILTKFKRNIKLINI